MIIIVLPFPPSVNRLWRAAGKRVYKTAVYREYGDAAWKAFRHQHPTFEMITDPVAMEIAAGRPDRRRRDIDNINKAILDVLEQIGVVQDDSQIHDLRSYWTDAVTGVQVMIKPLDADNSRTF